MMPRLLVALLFLLFVPASASVAASPDELRERELERRAIEAAIWGLPAVNTDLMLQEMLGKTTAKVNEVVYWGRPLDYRNQTLTPNPDVIYFMVFFDTRDVGAIVLEVPPADDGGSLTGNTMTVWQTALEDVGALGVDKGAGGKFVFVPPGFDGRLPEGYSVLKSDTATGYALLRSNMKSHSEKDVAASIAYGKRLKVYPLAKAGNPPETRFTDAKDVLYDSTIRYDASLFESLSHVLERERWLERDRAMIDQLRTIGIERGKPFQPDAETRKILDVAAKEAGELLSARYDQGFPPFYPGSHWTYPTLQEAIEGQGSNYADKEKYAVDARALLYTYGYISIKRPGTAQFYMISIRDKNGDGFDGGKTYRLTVPQDAPVKQYWSVTAYDRQTHALIKNVHKASVASNSTEVTKNADGPTDVYFGATAPKGKEANWVPTDPARGFELMFRVYGPTPAFFDKTWVLPDVVKND